MRLILTGIAVALMLLGAAVFRRQAKATSCPRHRRVAGNIAVVAASASLVGGIGLIVYSLFVLGG